MKTDRGLNVVAPNSAESDIVLITLSGDKEIC